MDQHKDVARRAAKFRVDSHPYLVVNLLEAPFDKPFGWPFDKLMVQSNVEGLMVQSEVEGLTALNNVEGLRPPLLRVMQNIGHCTISP